MTNDPRPNLLPEVWIGFRPYLVRIAIDFLTVACLWIVLFLFKLLTKLLVMDGWVAGFIVNLHSVGAVAAYAMFAAMFVFDVYRLHRQER